MTNITAGKLGTVVLTESVGGHGVVPEGTPLTFLNYFDGMLMRAELMNREQQGFTALSKLSNQAGGHGVVWGFDSELTNDSLHLGAGLAIDTGGRVVYSPGTIRVGVADLIAASSTVPTPAPQGTIDSQSAFRDCVPDSAPDPAVVVEGVNWYVITVGQIDALCGDEDVYGRLCEEACITASDRPYRIRGVVVRAEPLTAALSLPGSSAVSLGGEHLRSRIASAFFEYERHLIASRISASGLSSDVWCKGARLPGSITIGVPVALLARSGSESLFLDRWIVTRERMEAPPRRYWAQVMAMRPWNVFLAQVLQFQCQLNNLFQGGGGAEDPCAEARSTMRRSSERLAGLIESYERTSRRLMEEGVDVDPEPVLSGLRQIESGLKDESFTALIPDRLLISGGIVELPSAGYLPVKPGSGLTVNEQVRRMMGGGVDLRFCVVRPDFVPHALEEAQHMERISLLQGLDDPANKPKVDVLVPSGEIETVSAVAAGTGYEMTLNLEALAIQLLMRLISPRQLTAGDALAIAGPRMMLNLVRDSEQQTKAAFRGAARGETLATGGYGFYFAGAFRPEIPEGPPAFTLIELLKHSAIWIGSELDRDPFAMGRNESTGLSATFSLLLGGSLIRTRLSGDLRVGQVETAPDRDRVRGALSGSLTVEMDDPTDGGPASRVITISDDVDLVRDKDGTPRPPLAVILPSPSLMSEARNLVLFEASRRWENPSTATVDGAVRMRQGSQPSSPSFTLVELGERLPLFDASQTINADVLRPGNADHQSALTGIRAIAAALGNPEFEDLATGKLFPPPRRVEAELRVKAVADWVLFHRRRDKRCELEQPPVDLESRRYRVYHVGLQDIEQVPALDGALRSGDSQGVARLDPSPTGIVEFAAGIQTLESPADVARAEWRIHAPSSGDIVYGAVASIGEALDEGEALALARLGNLANVLATATPVAADAPLEFLQSVPAGGGIIAQPHDGIMIMATVPVATTCHEVYRFEAASHQAVTGLRTRIGGTGAERLAELLEDAGAVRMGRALFRQDTHEPLPDSDPMAAQWRDLGDGAVTHIVSISQRPEDPNELTEAEKARIETFRRQSDGIVDTLGAPLAADEVLTAFPEDAGQPSPCPAFTVIVARPG